MSLKQFHIFFILSSITVVFGSSFWFVRDFQVHTHLSSAWLGGLMFGLGGALFFYLLSIIKKFKSLPRHEA